ELAVRRRADPPYRREVLLRVQLQALRGYLPVQVDGQLRDPKQRAVDPEQALLAVGQAHAPRQTEISVQPRVEQDSAVDLHRQLTPARRGDVGAGFDPEVRAVGVGSDDTKR